MNLLIILITVCAHNVLMAAEICCGRDGPIALVKSADAIAVLVESGSTPEWQSALLGIPGIDDSIQPVHFGSGI